MQFNDLPTSAHAVFGVSWGYEIDVGLVLTKRSWGMILRGRAVTLRGKGYSYEGDSFNDIWHFAGGLDGHLEVNYGQRKIGDYSGQGYLGKPRDALLGTRDDLPPATFEHNGLEFWDHRRFVGVEPTSPSPQRVVPNVEITPKKLIHSLHDVEAEQEKRRLALAPFAREIERAVNDWKLSQRAGSGINWGYGRAVRADSIRRRLEEYCLAKRIFPKGNEITSLIRAAIRF